MTRPSLLSTTVLAGSLLLGLGSLAHADSHTCELVAEDVIAADGITEEWKGMGRTRVGGSERDASFAVRCAYDQKRLYLAVEVRDDYLYRGKKPSSKKDDHLSVALRVGGRKSDRLVVYPGNDKVGPTRRFNGRKLPKWLEAEDAQAHRGWALEVAMPLARLRGFSKSAASIDAFIEYRDSDYSAKIESKLAFDGQLDLQGADELFQSFLASAKLSAADIRLDRTVDVDDSPGPERVVAGGSIVGIISDQYFFMQLPVASPKDVSKVQVADLRGDGTHSIITELRQHGNGGSRDLVIVWQVAANRLQQVLSIETRKQKGGNVLSNRWSLAPRGKYRKGRRSKKGRDLVIEVVDSDAQGWDEDNYFEQQAEDVLPILTPWSDQTSAVYYFEGNSAQGGDPMVGRKKRRRK